MKSLLHWYVLDIWDGWERGEGREREREIGWISQDTGRRNKMCRYVFVRPFKELADSGAAGSGSDQASVALALCKRYIVLPYNMLLIIVSDDCY